MVDINNAHKRNEVCTVLNADFAKKLTPTAVPKMRDFIRLAKKWFRYRYSGVFERYIESIDSCLKIINTLPSDFWLLWYMDYLQDYLALSKMNRVFPVKHYKINNKALAKIAKGNRVFFKDIVLPLPDGFHERSDFLSGSLEVLFGVFA